MTLAVSTLEIVICTAVVINTALQAYDIVYLKSIVHKEYKKPRHRVIKPKEM